MVIVQAFSREWDLGFSCADIGVGRYLFVWH
jgi:hypothetical protein